MIGFDVGGLRRRFVFWPTAAVGGLVALAVSAALGVFDVQAKHAVPELQPGTPIAAGRWLVDVERAWIGSTLPDGRNVALGQRALIVEATLTNRSAETSNAFSRLFKPIAPSLGLQEPPVLYLERDRDLLRQLHPGLGEKVAVVWTFPDAGPPPDQVRLALQGETYKPRDNLYASAGWFDPHTVGSFTLRLERRD